MSRQMSADGLATLDLVHDITQQIHSVSPLPVGYGGCSDIYTGLWRTIYGEKKVAIKVIRLAPALKSGELPRDLRREISVWKRISHPNIHDLCGVYEGFGPAPALVSPWYEYGDINAYVRQRTTDPDAEVVKLRLFAGVATGLKFLHDHHIVHGDIKGGNVLISNDGVPRLCDFGLSRLLLEHSLSTTTTGGRGTVRWMAPELLLQEGAHHSYASDIWAYGCLIIEVWSDVKPYHGKANDQQVILALFRRERPDRPADMPDMVWRVVEACCSFKSIHRPSASNLVRAISIRLTVQRVYPMVTCNHPIDFAGSDLLSRVEASLRDTGSQHSSGLSTMSDAELVTEIIRRLAVFSLFGELSPLLQDAVFVWCLAKLGTGGLLLPPGVSIPDVDGDEFVSEFSGSHEPANLRPLARLVDCARPGLAKHLMAQFSTPALCPPWNIDTLLWSVTGLSCGNRIVVGCGDGMVRVLDVETRETLLLLAGHTGCVNQVALSPDGTLLTSCSDDQSIRLWDFETGHAIGEPMVGHTDCVNSVAFSPDGLSIVSGSNDDTIRIWSMETCTTVLGPFCSGSYAVYSVAYSPDGSRIVFGSADDIVRVWDARTGDEILSLRGHTSAVKSVAYSPDGVHIVSGSWDRTVRIWDAAIGQPVGNPLEGYSGLAWSVAYSPDGAHIVSGSEDHMIRIHNVATGDSIITPSGHSDCISSVAFSPDGNRLVSASLDGTLRIWDGTDEWMRWDI